VQALEQAVRSADQLLISSQRSFQAGVRTRLDILNAEQQAGQARRDLAQARFQYLLARVRLKALAGSMRVDNIDEINAWLQH
jgi:outer membrane protein/protease secretion system outer membrane protein